MMKLSYFGCLTGPAFEDFGVYFFASDVNWWSLRDVFGGPGLVGFRYRSDLDLDRWRASLFRH
jgi:hypothetical protein